MAGPPSAGAEWARGWKLVLASAAGMSLAPLLIYTTGLFVAPLEKEFGWSRTMVTSGMTLNAVVGVLFAGPFGALIDRYGPRRIAIPGVALFCLALAALATLSGSVFQWWIIWTGIAFTALMVKATVWTAAVVSSFDKARGLALALVLSGSGFTGIIAPAIAGYLINNHGWRWGYSGLAALWFSVSMALVLFFFRGAGDMRGGEAGPHRERLAISGAGLLEALRSTAFVKLAVATFMVILVVTGSLVHFVPMLTDRGLERSTAVPLASILGLTAFIGRMITGMLLDRVDVRYVGAVAFAMPGLACCLMLSYPGSMSVGAAAVAAICFGFASGAEFEVASYLASYMFGLRNFGTLFGLLVGIIALAAGVGPLMASMAFDRFASYDVALWAGAPFAFAAALLVWTMPEYRPTQTPAV